MSKIKVLPAQLINQIAAGEVVERPASVVKELFENSLDAESTQIVLEIASGGRELIRVTDNGCGLSPVEARMALERHATSKISKAEDLFQINTFGFRGEALPSIASVSEFSLKTRLADETAGFELTLSAGKLQSEGPAGLAPGTQITVRKLFWNTPARLKYLKTEQSELTQIVKTFTEIALVHPEVSFTFIKDGKEYLNLPAKQELVTRLEGLLNLPQEKLLPVYLEGFDFKLSGFISKPELNFKSKSKQIVYVNERPITNPLVNYTVREAYGTLLPPQVQPAFVLLLEIAPELVDVNVHPRKTEVRFVNQVEVLNKFKQAVSQTLRKNDLTPGFNQTSSPTTTFSTNSVTSSPEKQGNLELEMEVQEKNDAGSPYRAIGQVENSYILSSSSSGLVIFDQHAAHERLLYEALLANQIKPKQQTLLMPRLLKLSPQEDATFQEFKQDLQALGFDFEALGNLSYSLSSVPAPLGNTDIEKLLSESLGELSEVGKIKNSTAKLDRLLKTMACKAAVKFNDQLSLLEQQALLDKLHKLENGYTCPHGRPLKFEISYQELRGRFGR